jgi:hypothetical protein
MTEALAYLIIAVVSLMALGVSVLSLRYMQRKDHENLQLRALSLSALHHIVVTESAGKGLEVTLAENPHGIMSIMVSGGEMFFLNISIGREGIWHDNRFVHFAELRGQGFNDFLRSVATNLREYS